MRDYFRWHYRPTEDQFSFLWKNGIFIFDTNVLLAMYRYPEQVRNIFFSVMGKISERIWIPYQVGLEFHRNRFSRINTENKKVNDIIDRITSNGLEIIKLTESLTKNNVNAGVSPEEISTKIKEFRIAHERIISSISVSKKNLPISTLDDPIGIKISELFEGKVGSPPRDQSEIDELTRDADDRYNNKIPPGFKDNNPKDESYFFDGKIKYRNKYGDLIIWKQSIAHARDNNIKNIIFVTDDSKTDWWDVDNHQTRGPLPALIQEIIEVGGVDLFWMYKSDQFLQFAEKYINANEVTEETINQVKDIVEKSTNYQSDAEIAQNQIAFDKIPTTPQDHSYRNETINIFMDAEMAIHYWLIGQLGGRIFNGGLFPEYVAKTPRGVIGIETIAMETINLERILAISLNISKKRIAETLHGEIIGLSLIVASKNKIEESEIKYYQKMCEEISKISTVAPIVIGNVIGDEFIPLVETIPL
ncbi:PIN-like domain-containing protein [Nitrospirillum bahiense]|uniref:PIN like domain-containing protein n=1 Tax=Nitrospirillum amazonense TaxID=28077 RepID=A0A560FJ09_9PROT|nr:PIN-like domain-containing protein [Nitrospirillum amazonense]TWB21589.1 hypothetical protein FBZ88_118107 [Nitrospirillum amazonense]